MRRILDALVIVATLAATAGAQAALVPRLGGIVVYDTDRDLTWLADANAGAGSAFDDGFDAADGLMSWANARAWADSLTVGGFTNWRLPTTLQPDPSCTSQAGGGTISSGGNCVGSEMGHLYYSELGGTFEPFNAPTNGILESGDPDLALFSNIQSLAGSGGIYHSATEFNAGNAWFFNFNGGQQGFDNKTFGRFAWAVHDGDIGAVPVPPAVVLLGSAVLVIVGRAARRG